MPDVTLECATTGPTAAGEGVEGAGGSVGSCPRKDPSIRLAPATPPFPETPKRCPRNIRIFPSNSHLREASSKILGKLGGYKLLNNVANGHKAKYNTNQVLFPGVCFLWSSNLSSVCRLFLDELLVDC